VLIAGSLVSACYFGSRLCNVKAIEIALFYAADVPAMLMQTANRCRPSGAFP